MKKEIYDIETKQLLATVEVPETYQTGGMKEDKQVDRVFISNKDRLTRYGIFSCQLPLLNNSVSF